jgi:hypothetical protein
MVWDPRFDPLDPLLCESCGEAEADLGSLLCRTCQEAEAMDADEAMWWAAVEADALRDHLESEYWDARREEQWANREEHHP